MAKKKAGSGDEVDDTVAVKIMEDGGYAKREIAILSELSKKYQHPHIIRIIEHFPAKDGSANATVLSLARGPTLQYILNKGGAISLVIAQSISQQLIDAVAFLHGHAGRL